MNALTETLWLALAALHRCRARNLQRRQWRLLRRAEVVGDRARSHIYIASDLDRRVRR